MGVTSACQTRRRRHPPIAALLPSLCMRSQRAVETMGSLSASLAMPDLPQRLGAGEAPLDLKMELGMRPNLCIRALMATGLEEHIVGSFSPCWYICQYRWPVLVSRQYKWVAPMPASGVTAARPCISLTLTIVSRALHGPPCKCIRRGYFEKPHTGQCNPEGQSERTNPECVSEGLERPGFADACVLNPRT